MATSIRQPVMPGPPLRYVVCCGLLAFAAGAKESQSPPFPFSTYNTELPYPWNYMNLDNQHFTDRYGGKYMPDHYILVPQDKVPPKLAKDSERRREEFSKAISVHYDPDFYNCTIEYFVHPKSGMPTPNYRINLQSDLFGGMRMSDRVASLDAFLEPLLLKPYRLTINARGFVSAEFHDARASREKLKAEYAKYLDEEMKNYHQPGPMEARMREKLTKAFDPEICQVQNESYKFDEPDDAETHFAVAVVSYKFVRKSTKEAEEMIRHILREELPLLKSLNIIADVPVILPTLIPTPKLWYHEEMFTHRPLEVEAWPF